LGSEVGGEAREGDDDGEEVMLEDVEG